MGKRRYIAMYRSNSPATLPIEDRQAPSDMSKANTRPIVGAGLKSALTAKRVFDISQI